MSNRWTVVVASWKRAGAVVTDRIVRDAKIIVPESQAEEYREKQELRNGAELVVFGDNDNDVPMFEVADRALAVENATEKLRAYASEVIGPNESDSVVRRILADLGR